MTSAPANLEARTVPIFPSRNLDATLEFYRRLSFELVKRHDDAGYLLLRLGELELHFFVSQATEPSSNDHACYVRVNDSRALRAAWDEVGHWGSDTFPRLSEVQATDYGQNEFAMVDPDGNLMRVGSPAED